VEGLLAAQPGGGGGMAEVVADVGEAMIRRAYSAVCSRPGMMPGWKLRTHPGAGFQVADRVLDGRQAAEPDAEGCLVDGRLG
jgi:hypothetical protein